MLEPSFEITYMSRAIATLSLMWGSCYFLLKEDEIRYGSVAVILAVLLQPLFDMPFGRGTWVFMYIFSSVFLILGGLLCIKIERKRALDRARREAELGGYKEHDHSHVRHTDDPRARH